MMIRYELILDVFTVLVKWSTDVVSRYLTLPTPKIILSLLTAAL